MSEVKMAEQAIERAYVEEPMFAKPTYRDFIPEGDPDEEYYRAQIEAFRTRRDFIPEAPEKKK